MSTGISMSSVNKIKELADNGDYSLALDILEHQDLSKSLSPQFIRICGEVYYENKRYADARAALVKAHSMAPAGNKIIYSIIRLYLSMGFRKLAEHYYEIYKFNQNGKDVGTYRIEYMIAKAYRKPVNELYSILISANEMETDEEWEFEMLLLHAYIRNKEKYESACVEYRANYRNSSRLYLLDSLMDSSTDLESMIYCFPVEDKDDDDPEQKNTRELEKKILAEDDLNIHPKDAKIMIMVEDDAPVSSSMKFKQMWIRSRDRKEQKKEQKREELLEEGGDEIAAAKKSRGFWGLMSRKEEALVDQDMTDIQKEHLSKEQLIGEIVEGQQSDESSEEKAEDQRPEAESDSQVTQDIPVDDKEAVSDVDPEREDIEDEPEDSFVIEEEPEEVVMVSVDESAEPEEEQSGIDLSTEEDQEPDTAPVETFDPEFDDDGDTDTESSFDFDKAFESLEEFDVDSEEDIQEIDEPEFDTEPDSEVEIEIEVEPESETEAEADTETEPVSESEVEAELEIEAVSEPEAEADIETEAVSEAEADIETELMSESEVEVELEIEAEPETESEQEPGFEAETEPEFAPESEMEFESEAEEEPEPLEEAENSFSQNRQNSSGFPVFKSSLFPDYNTENAFLYDLNTSKKADIEDEEEKITENLKKEEDLIGETDRLLARLGIKFNTEFKSILEFDDDEASDDDFEEKENTTDVQEESETGSEPEPQKKPFKLKGLSK